jgi:uncharacterized protein (DUF2461 family)
LLFKIKTNNAHNQHQNKDSIDFLKDLSQNNNREWFNAQKDRYLEAASWSKFHAALNRKSQTSRPASPN